MANNEKVYLMKLPQITPEQYMRNCYINLANLTSSAEALSDLKMSETIQMPTVTIKHTFFVDAAYTAQIGREEVDQEVVHETHKYDDGTTYEKAVIKETTRIEWDPHEGKLNGASFETLIPLPNIDMSAFGVKCTKNAKPYWKEQGWIELEVKPNVDGWVPANDEMKEKLQQVPFDFEAFQEERIKHLLPNKIMIQTPYGYKHWDGLQYTSEVTRSKTTIGVQVDYRVKCEYKGQTFHFPHIGKETIPLPTKGNIKKEFKSKASTFNFTARKEYLYHNHTDYNKNRKLKEKMILAMLGSGAVGLLLTMIAANVLFLLLGAAGAAGAWLMFKRTNAAMAKIEEEATRQATQEYEQLKAEEETEIAEHNASFESLKEKKIEALNALFTEKGMQPLNEEEKEQLK